MLFDFPLVLNEKTHLAYRVHVRRKSIEWPGQDNPKVIMLEWMSYTLLQKKRKFLKVAFLLQKM